MSFIYFTESRMFITCSSFETGSTSFTRTVYFTLKSFLTCFITGQIFTLSNPLAAEFYLSTPRATTFTIDASNRVCITFHLHLVPTHTGMMPKTTTFTLDIMPGWGLHKLTGNIKEDESTGEWGTNDDSLLFLIVCQHSYRLLITLRWMSHSSCTRSIRKPRLYFA